MNRVIAWIGTAVLVAAVAATPAALAQTSKRAKVMELIRLTKTGDNMSQMLPTILEQITAEIRKLNAEIPDAAFDIVNEEIIAVFEESRPHLLESMVPLFEKYYTEEEIDGLVAFYGTALGQKMIEVTPKLAQESLALGMQWGQIFGLEAMRRVVERLKREGYEL